MTRKRAASRTPLEQRLDRRLRARAREHVRLETYVNAIIAGLERRVSAIEAVLNGRLTFIGEGLRGLNDVNGAMNRSMQEIREVLGLRRETGAEKALERLAKTQKVEGGEADA
jgi:hypothetical protein